MAFRPQDTRIYRPYPDAVPYDLLSAGGCDEDELAATLALDEIRVAKLDGRPVAAYALRAATGRRYDLLALGVAHGFRRRGLGRWMLGHAIGLAETQGGREIFTRLPPVEGARAARFLERLGFEPANDGLLLVLTPE
ncbi:MAG: GNAT family N-acetyltransferase [Pseudomonadota bacterium]